MEKEKFKLHIDSVEYKDKEIAKKNAHIIKYRLQGKSPPVEVPLEKVIEELQKGKTISPAVMKGSKADDFVEQQIFMVDIDNKRKGIPILQIDEALEICKKNHLPPIFYYPTFSHTDEIPKFRIVFVMNEVIKDNEIRLIIMESLISLFEQADTSCTNADRLFFGTDKKAVICDLDARITVDTVLGAVPTKSIMEEKEKLISSEFDSELDKLKKDFDFFDYLKKRNGKVKIENEKYAMFETCEICGHKDDLVYYKYTNTFCCFGAGRKKGGSIIDYLMAVDKLTVAEAVNKFKYELCGLKKEKKVIHSITAKELATKELPKPYVVVKNLLAQGFSIIAGQPKLGKSWLALDLCYCVCTGQPFLDFETTQSACLYLALEDNEGRLKERMYNILGDYEKFPENLHLVFKCKPLNEGLIEELEQYLKEDPNIKLIVIDTLQKVRGVQGRNQNAYDYDYKEIGKLKDFADEHKLCILVIHHLRKMKDPYDPFNNISGSTGITGAADTSIVLYKDKFNDSNAHFVTESRDFESIEKILFFDHYKWNIIGDYDGLDKEIEKLSYKTNPIVITINKLLEENPEGVKISSTELLKKIIKTTGTKPKQEKPNVLTRHITNELQFDLLEFDGIYYEPPNENGGGSGRKMYFSKPKKDI